MANRGHAFIRGLYAQNQNLTNLVRRSGREAVVSTDSTPKRKRDDENLVAIDSLSPSTESTIFESELYSCLFDQNNRCTIFDLDDPSATTNVPAVEMELERFKLSPSRCEIFICFDVFFFLATHRYKLKGSKTHYFLCVLV